MQFENHICVLPAGLDLLFAILPVRQFFLEDQRQIKNNHPLRPPRLCGEKLLLLLRKNRSTEL
jgi:hypothetical protein